jgi:ribosome-associated protein
MSTDPARDPQDPAPDAQATPRATGAPAEAPVKVPAEVGAEAPARAAPRAGLPARTTPPPEIDRESLDLARRIVELAEDKKAADIVLLEIAPLTTVADYLVLCSGGSERQLDAIADGITEGLKAEGIRILAREGQAVSHWVLLDVGAVVVHVFAPPEREYYALERLWAEARTVLRVQ